MPYTKSAVKGLADTIARYTAKIERYNYVLTTGKNGFDRVHGDTKTSVDAKVTTWLSQSKDGKTYWRLLENEHRDKIIIEGSFARPAAGDALTRESLAAELLKADVKAKFKEVTGDTLKFKGE